MKSAAQLSANKKVSVKTNHRLKRNVGRGIIYAILIILAIICLLPFYSMIISSTHSNFDIANKLLLLPGDQFIENYSRLVEKVPIWRGFFNSVILTVSGTALTLYFSALTAYGFSKYNFKFSNFLFAAVLAMLMIPGEVSIVGFF